MAGTAQVERRETRAVLRYAHVAPNKIRAVLGLIRGIDVDEARDRLRFCDRGAAQPVTKLLDSAVANAEHNDELPPDELFVIRAFADEGPTQKRLRPRARGRGVQIRKRTSHVTIVVARYTDDELEKRRRREESTGGTAEARRRASRRRRVRASTEAAEGHDHDHQTDAPESGAPESDVSANDAAEPTTTDTPDTDTPDTDTPDTDTPDTDTPEELVAQDTPEPGDDQETK